jgi:hypothetical protein
MPSASGGLITGPVLAAVSRLHPAVVRVLIQMSPAAAAYPSRSPSLHAPLWSHAGGIGDDRPQTGNGRNRPK